jgi:hypothetical protein
LDLLEEHLSSELEAGILMFRDVEKACDIASRFVRCFQDETPTN